MNTKPTRAPTAHIVPFGLRLQPELKERIERAATENGRSLNSEIALRIEQSFDPQGAALPIPPDLKKDLEDNAREYGRTLTEEIVKQLEYAMAWDQSIMPATLGKEISAYRKENSLGFKEAMERLVSAGLHPDAPTVVILNVGGDVDIEQLGAALDKMRAKLPRKSRVIVEQYPKLKSKKPNTK